MQPNPGKRQELVLTPPRDSLHLLRNRGGEAVGKTYHKAEGRLAMHVTPQADGAVRMELVPELPRYLLLGKGFAISPTEMALSEETVRQDR